MEPRIGRGGRSKSFLDLLEWRVDVALENVQTTVRRGHKYPLHSGWPKEGRGQFSLQGAIKCREGRTTSRPIGGWTRPCSDNQSRAERGLGSQEHLIVNKFNLADAISEPPIKMARSGQVDGL